MKKEILMGIITAILLGACVVIYYTNSSDVTFLAVSEEGVCSDMACFNEKFIACTPAKIFWESIVEGEAIQSSLEIIGIIDNLCYFKMTRENDVVRECYFEQSVLSAELAEQFLKGKDNGFGQVIADSCK